MFWRNLININKRGMVDSAGLNDELKQKLAKYCFSNLHGFLKDNSADTLDYPEEFNNLKNPLFVTW